MSELLIKRNNYPPLQKQIILHLAHSAPQTINEATKEIKGHYKSSWTAFNTLEKKGLITQVASKSYRGREYPESWLTERGILLALYLGAKPQIVLRRTIEIYPNERNLHFIIEAVLIFRIPWMLLWHVEVIKEEAIKQEDLIPIFLVHIAMGLTLEQKKQFKHLFRKYPEQKQQYNDYFNEIHKSLKELLEWI